MDIVFSYLYYTETMVIVTWNIIAFKIYTLFLITIPVRHIDRWNKNTEKWMIPINSRVYRTNEDHCQYFS